MKKEDIDGLAATALYGSAIGIGLAFKGKAAASRRKGMGISKAIDAARLKGVSEYAPGQIPAAMAWGNLRDIQRPEPRYCRSFTFV